MQLAPDASQGSSPLPHSWARLAVEVLAAVLLCLLLVLLLLAMGLRLAGVAEPRLFELTRVLFVFLTAIAAVVAYARGHNLRVPGAWKEGTPSYEAAHLAVALVLTLLTARYVQVQGFATDATSLLGLPEVVPYLPVLLFGAGVTVTAFLRLRRALRSRRTGEGA